MLRPLDVFFLGAALAVVTGTYMVKYGSEIENSEISRLEHKIQQQRDAIDVLNADWALLTSPSRMQKLADQYGDELQLKGLDMERIVRISDIPMRPKKVPDTRKVQLLKIVPQGVEVADETTASIKAIIVKQGADTIHD